MYHAEIVFGKINARSVSTAFQDKPLPVRRHIGFSRYEIVLGEAEMFRYSRYLGFVDTDDSVLYAAARAALAAFKSHVAPLERSEKAAAKDEVLLAIRKTGL